MTKKLPFAELVWNDAWVDASDPVNLADVAASHKPKVIKTIGYVLQDDEVGISIANEHYGDEDVYRGRTFVPRAMVVKLTVQKMTKPRPRKEKPVATVVEETTV